MLKNLQKNVSPFRCASGFIIREPDDKTNDNKSFLNSPCSDKTLISPNCLYSGDLIRKLGRLKIYLRIGFIIVLSRQWKPIRCDEEFAVNHQDVRELVLGEETLDEEELTELIDAPTSNALVNKNKENEWVPNLDLQDVKKRLNLAKELELHFIQTGHSTVRSAKFKRELRNCSVPYREVLVELEKKATF
ncbi:hypothetical protein NPIL_578541 [Nephila pilipes]|uniref:Uncharacterized protein n=1 Tax=Nephila pilipes TaxID=299642 RepID=A0A8X6PED8_NEPPI|nr:hypothetical protein NPIL_578541 [Nephila pilipes]